jgi:hypothetical protein
MFVKSPSILKDFFDHYLNIEIDNLKLNELNTEDEIIDYILNLFLSRYLPK